MCNYTMSRHNNTTISSRSTIQNLQNLMSLETMGKNSHPVELSTSVGSGECGDGGVFMLVAVLIWWRWRRPVNLFG